MAFFDPAHGAPAMPATAASAPTQLDPLGRRVVQLSRRDTVASLGERSRLRRLVSPGAANRLADPRLETLRAYAVMLRHGGDEAAAPFADALVAAGYTVRQVTHARWLVAREARADAGPPAVSRLALGCAILLAVWLGTLAGHATADRVIGLVAGLLVAISLAPLLAIDARPRRRGGGVARA